MISKNRVKEENIKDMEDHHLKKYNINTFEQQKIPVLINIDNNKIVTNMNTQEPNNAPSIRNDFSKPEITRPPHISKIIETKTIQNTKLNRVDSHKSLVESLKSQPEKPRLDDLQFKQRTLPTKKIYRMIENVKESNATVNSPLKQTSNQHGIRSINMRMANLLTFSVKSEPTKEELPIKKQEMIEDENQVCLSWKNKDADYNTLYDILGFTVLCHYLNKQPIIEKEPHHKPKYYIEIDTLSVARNETGILTPHIVFDYLQRVELREITYANIIDKYKRFATTLLQFSLLSQPCFGDNQYSNGKWQDIGITNLPFYSQTSICLVIRGHIRESFNNSNLYQLVKETAAKYHKLRIYIHTWNKKSSKLSWRNIEEDNTEVTEELIKRYFKDTAKYIQTIIIDDDTQIEIKGEDKGLICKTLQPIVAWKRMWYGIHRIVEDMYADSNNQNKIVINTRFDIMQNSHSIGFTDFHSFVKKSIQTPKLIRNVFHKNSHSLFGIDNLYSGDRETVKTLVTHFYSNLDTIIKQYPTIYVQEVIVFYENNRLFGGLSNEEIYKDRIYYEKNNRIS
jgi:hypothetical protein